MTKSEKNALADVVAMLNAIINSNDEDGKNKQYKPIPSEEENPSKEEIEFVRKMANNRPFDIIGRAVKLEEGLVADIDINRTCFDHMITAYLEKYCHE